jgi:hypothetical protein
MGKDERIISLNEEEHGIVVNALLDKHNDLVEKEGPFEAVDDVLMKVLHAPRKNDRRQEDMEAR